MGLKDRKENGIETFCTGTHSYPLHCIAMDTFQHKDYKLLPAFYLLMHAYGIKTIFADVKKISFLWPTNAFATPRKSLKL